MTRVFQPVPDVIEATVQYNYFGQLVENKFYVKANVTPTLTIVAEVADILDDWVTTSMLPNLPSNCTYIRSIARDLTTAASFESIDATGAGAGSNSGTGLASNVTAAFHRATAFSGAKQKSRIYWPVILGGQTVDADHLASASGIGMIAILDALRTAFLAGVSATFDYGYVQRVIGGVRLSSGNFVQVLAHTLTDYVLDSMRDRLPGHGV
jgi:hypothetical protein